MNWSDILPEIEPDANDCVHWIDAGLNLVKERFMRDQVNGSVSSEEAERMWAKFEPQFRAALEIKTKQEFDRRVELHPILIDRQLTRDDFARLKQRLDRFPEGAPRKRYMRNLMRLAREHGINMESNPSQIVASILLETANFLQKRRLHKKSD
jgi:hypothetical protein